MRTIGVVALLSIVGFGGVTAGGQAPTKLEYDAFCKLPDVETKRAVFIGASDENQAELVRTQLERWRDANKARLTGTQLEFIAELTAFITPAMYRPADVSTEARAKLRALAAKQRELFTRDDMQAMEPNGPCIPKGKQPGD